MKKKQKNVVVTPKNGFVAEQDADTVELPGFELFNAFNSGGGEGVNCRCEEREGNARWVQWCELGRGERERVQQRW
jgi:hypothetical protein